MWLAKIRLQHDCILGNRCKKFGISLQSLNLNEEKKQGSVSTSSLHQMIGDENQIASFVKDLKKDPRTEYVELNKNTLFLIEHAKNKPVSAFNQKMFFVKPVLIDTKGYEHWEIASHKKEELIKFISQVKSITQEFILCSIKNMPLHSVYFPKLLPSITHLQKKALELAIEKGYYHIPKKTSLRSLAILSRVSLATYQKHLQKAESKIIPDILSFLK